MVARETQALKKYVLCVGAAGLCVALLALTAYSRAQQSAKATVLLAGNSRQMMPKRGRIVAARQTMLRGLGSGPEQESQNDWHVAISLDAGCKHMLDEKGKGNVAWRRITDASCIPNKRVNPFMWPFDVPGKSWSAVDGKYPSDSARDATAWPYNHKDLHTFVEKAQAESPTYDWADGILHGNPAPKDAEEEDDEEEADPEDKAAEPESGEAAAEPEDGAAADPQDEAAAEPENGEPESSESAQPKQDEAAAEPENAEGAHPQQAEAAAEPESEMKKEDAPKADEAAAEAAPQVQIAPDHADPHDVAAGNAA